MTDNDHYFTPRPKSRGGRQIFTITLRGFELNLITEAGVFSRQRVDRGTRLLIEHFEVGEQDCVLDLGCGYGVVGIVAARLAVKGRATLVDINERAVALARNNLRANGIQNAEVYQGDGFSPIARQSFNVIALNPPIRAGFAVVHRLIEGSSEHLAPGGRLYLVGQTAQGVLRLAVKMREAFGNLEEVAKGGGYRLFISRQF